jgi:hypothetical protein
MGGDGRSDSAKPDWLCKKCERGSGKEPYKNYGSRTHCHSCGGAKGQCYLRDAARASKSPTTSLAERQTSLAKEKDREIQKLLAQLAAERNVAKKLEASRKLRPQPEPEEGADVVEPSKGPTLDQLLKAKAVYDGWGEAGRGDSDRLAVQIAEVREATLATKPGHVQIHRADQRVVKAKAACSKHPAKSEGLRVQMETLQKTIADFAELRAKEDQELLDAEAAYSCAVKAIQAPEATAAGPGFGEKILAMGDAFWSKSGTSKALFQTFIDSVAAEEKAEQDKKDAVTAAATAAAAEQEAARRAAEKAQLDSEPADGHTAPPAPVGSCAEDDGAFMSDVLAGLDGANLDPMVKRSIEAAQEVAKRRKLLKK